jgi:hypothetical protein
MVKRQTIGENPLDSLIEPITSQDGHPVNTVQKYTESAYKKPKQTKQRITVQISVDVIERIKNAVYWTPGLTLASLAEDAFSKTVDKLEKERKAPFPRRKEELKTGRPIS